MKWKWWRENPEALQKIPKPGGVLVGFPDTPVGGGDEGGGGFWCDVILLTVQLFSEMPDVLARLLGSLAAALLSSMGRQRCSVLLAVIWTAGHWRAEGNPSAAEMMLLLPVRAHKQTPFPPVWPPQPGQRPEPSQIQTTPAVNVTSNQIYNEKMKQKPQSKAVSIQSD